MHFSVWALHVLLESFLLLVVEDFADLVVRLKANWPHPGETILTGQALVLRDPHRGVMQVLKDWLNFGLLIVGEIELDRQDFQLIIGARHIVLHGGLALSAFVDRAGCGSRLLRGHIQCEDQDGPERE